MKFNDKEQQGLDEISHLVGLQEHASNLLKTRGIDLIDMNNSSFEINYNSNGEVIFKYQMKGRNDRHI